MRNKRISIAIIVAYFVHTFAQTFAAVSIDDFEARLFDPDNNPQTKNMPNRIFKPKGQDPSNTTKKYPLIIHLHGLGAGNGNNITQMSDHGIGGMYFADDEQQALQPSFVLIPQEPQGPQHWQSEPVKTLLIDLIDSVIAEFPNIDEDRIYIGGMSMGGLGTWKHLIAQPDKFAAAYFFAAAGNANGAESIKHVPMWFFHGSADKRVKPPGTTIARVDKLRELGASPIFTFFHNVGHSVAPRSGSIFDLYEWLMQQRLNEAHQPAPLLRITEYSIGSDLDVSGIMEDERAQVFEVTWSQKAGTVTETGNASGTYQWSATDIPLSSGKSNTSIIAKGWSFDPTNPYYEFNPKDADRPEAGYTVFSQSIEVDYSIPTGDAVPPGLITASPAHSDFAISTESTVLTFSGTASDETALDSVTWETDRGQSGTATGTDSWSADVPLVDGLNRLTITASDVSGNIRRQIFYVTKIDPVVNEAPRVLTGSDLLTSMPNNTVDLDAALGDDGLPVAANLQWTKVSGPGTVTFANANAVDTTATFSSEGTYVLRLTADDTLLTDYDEITVIVTEESVPVAGPGVLGINCGGDAYLASDGTQYVADNQAGFLLGGGRHTGNTTVTNTSDSTIYQKGYFPRGSVYWRDIVLPNGEYVVTLKMVNPNNAINNRIGDYYIEGYRVLNDFDVRAHVERNVALDRSFRVTINDGTLDVRMHVVKNSPLLCGILVQEAYTGPPVNSAPTVDAGPDQSVIIGNGAFLDATVTDDGLAPGDPTPTSTWTQISGPGTVTFADANAVDTTVTFPATGTYELELTATDGVLSSSDSVTITVTEQPVNTAPVVDAGVDQTVLLANGASLNGTVSDDGLPDNSTLTTTWSTISGPGMVTFGDANMAVTTATFSVEGSYVLQLSASDGELNSSDSVTITVNNQPPPEQLTVRYDFGTQSLPSSGNWNLVRYSGFDETVLDATDINGNPTPFDLRITDDFRGRDTTGSVGTNLYPDQATNDSFHTNLNKAGEVTFEGLNPSLNYNITVFASAAFDANNSGVGAYTVGSTTLTLDAADNANNTVTFTNIAPDSSGKIALHCISSGEAGRVFLNVVELTQLAPPPPPPATQQVLFDFGSQATPSTGNWNLVRYFGVNDGVTDAIDTDGNATGIGIRVTDDFKGRNTTGAQNTGLHPDNATYDSFFTNIGNLAELTLENLDAQSTYDITIFASANSTDAVGEYTIGTTTLTLDAENNTNQTITFNGIQPDSNGTIVLGLHASDSTGFVFINTLELAGTVSSQAVSAAAPLDTSIANDLTSGGLTTNPIGVAASGYSRILQNGEWEVNGSAAGLAGTADSVYSEIEVVSGDFQALVNVRTLSGGSTPQAGLILRESLDADSRVVAIATNSGNAYQAASRLSTGEILDWNTLADTYDYPNAWVLLERQGDHISVAISSDGSTFVEADVVTLNGLANDIQVGLFVSSGSATAQATFADYELILYVD
ncbi:PKD domain-containing protein [Rubellicoccus peritrichatus]|uniref:Malectin domain-containing carbohydrate-binding protein n=1 Tax=Rubellicoccus peritrichatus TaxID=3080537 RepID=A0AAQ3L511_9BACT|nr:malectin domain-containing carbohydrate-binding protein [Puniceicoccus sp. CR14]WOO39509.1 malectin domain-containing carbohydrate-binding protein [Puniceicoccus sp. CR14]